MLGALVRQAAHAGLVAEPGFTGKELRWMVQVHDGRFVGVISLVQGKAGELFSHAPDLSQPNLMALPKALGTAQAAHFLADTCGVVALLPAVDRDGNTKTDVKSLADHAKNEGKHLAFMELLRRAGEELPSIHAVCEMLSDPEQLAELQIALRQDAKPTDKLSFSVNGVRLLNSPEWHDWWREFRRGAFGRGEAETGGGMLDLTTGELVTPANTHPKLTKLGVGAIAVGASLIGYDKDAFSSYGLSAGENGAVSEANAAAYRAALDALLSEAPVLGQMKVAAWFDHREAEGQALIDALVDPSTLPDNIQEELDDTDYSNYDFDQPDDTPLQSSARQQKAVAKTRVHKLLTAIRQGESPDDIKARYFALAISGASGRAMVRDWHTGSLEQLAEGVATWFADLAIVTPSGRNAKRPKFFSLLLYIQRPKPASTGLDDYLRPIRNLQLPFWRAALEPTAPIPFSAIGKVMEAHKAHVMTGKFSEAISSQGAPEEKARIYTRMALLRAYHVRQARSKGETPMTSSLDPAHSSKAYHCGRLMYLLANVQDAQGSDINAGVVQRYYGAASATPALVLGRLTRLSQHHLAKISRDKPGLAFTLEQEIAQVWTALGANLPRTLSLEDQTLFALGYYQQLAHNSAQRQERAAAKRDEAAKATSQPTP